MAGAAPPLRTASAVLLLALAASPSLAAPPDAAAVKFFEDKVRPVLATRCYSCHGPAKQKGNLRLDSRAAVLHGGDSGPSLQSGKPDESLLLKAVRQAGELKMPPSGKLKAAEVADLAAPLLDALDELAQPRQLVAVLLAVGGLWRARQAPGRRCGSRETAAIRPSP